jgi:hypothetical protein
LTEDKSAFALPRIESQSCKLRSNLHTTLWAVLKPKNYIFSREYEEKKYKSNSATVLCTQLVTNHLHQAQSFMISYIFLLTFSEPCILIHILEKDQQNAHFFSLIYSN